MTKKITKKDNFTAIAAFLADNGKADWAAVINHEIELLDKKAAKAKETAATKKATNDELADAVVAVLSDEFATINDITAAVEFDGEISNAKVQARLNKLVENGVAVKEQISVGDTGSKRKLMHYRRAN